MIGINRHEAGKLWALAFGLTTVADGLVRVVSLGWLRTTWPLDMAKYQALAIMKKKQSQTKPCKGVEINNEDPSLD